MIYKIKWRKMSFCILFSINHSCLNNIRSVKNTMYEKFFKRIIDIILSTIGIIVAAIPMLFIALVIKIDSPGPVFFRQKRVGLNKKLFTIVKFRSMPVTVPKDTPTHQFKAEDMLSKWQHFLRKSSLDEIPQFFCIWIGSMSVVGPRPALWNQDDLVAERDKYGANDIKPGLTGWAQIHGRDEIEIPIKAKLDGEYAARLKQGGFSAFWFDLRCFIGSITAVLKSDGVVEGGTGELSERNAEAE